MQYRPAEFEEKWQNKWEAAKVYRTSSDLAELRKKPKYYVLDMFPYPSGAGLHVGHPEGYTATDIIARYKRAKGFNVLHPMGWDAFGLPAERAAVRENIHPAIITKRYIDNFRRQLKRIGFSYDWERELSTTDADYYRWTQWIFLKLHERGLAYLAEVPVNWCAAMGTVLANEEVKDGRYVETGDIVERRMMKQWMLKITVYAERLLEDLDGLDWPENVKEMQRNWIGKSEGARIQFSVSNSTENFTVFTTRPDTLFGASFCVLAPEHPIVGKITSASERTKVEDYVAAAKQKTDLARMEDPEQFKTGVFTGAYAIHPLTQEKLPIWIADYVLISYGTGAIMAVPGHDERDHAFAKQFKLPIIEVVSGGKESIELAPFTDNESGILVNSQFLNGLNVHAAKARMIQEVEKRSLGKGEVQYKLRDWLFSRQRYWGEPFPMIHLEDGSVVPVPEDALPVELPAVDEYKPTADGRPPLARASQAWLQASLPSGKQGQRETNTMPQWAGSCWYYLRFIDPKNSEAPFSGELEKYWLPVDLYVGGIEHAVLHLLYARFWHKVLFDAGLVSTKEPFQKLFNQGLILAYSFQNQAGKYFSPQDVRFEGSEALHKESGEPLKQQIEKMSKSKLNVVNPEEVIDRFGADSLRLYEMFMGPLDQIKPWKTDGVDGVYRFLARAWRLVVDENSGSISAKLNDDPGVSQYELWRTLHKTIRKVSEDIENLRFNTAISQMMIFVNEATGVPALPRETVQIFLRILSPFAPHVAEELWERMGGSGFVVNQDWPSFEPALCEDSSVTIVVMVNGKRREEFSAPLGKSEAELVAAAKALPKVAAALTGAEPKKIIVVPDKLVNFVI